jgi:hypothetical protein
MKLKEIALLTLTGFFLAVLTAYTSAAEPTEVSDGFEPLFNGKDLTGWVVEGTKTYKQDGNERNVWTVKDGNIHCAGVGYGFLRFDREFSDFVLKAEFRAAPKCNSGIGIRHVRFTGVRQSRPSYSGYEIQLLDDHGKQPDKHSTGSLYRHLAASKDAVRPAGEWNEITVECRGPRIKIILNGETVQDVDQTEHPKIANQPLKGYLSVQNHGGVIDFRNLLIKELQ